MRLKWEVLGKQESGSGVDLYSDSRTDGLSFLRRVRSRRRGSMLIGGYLQPHTRGICQGWRVRATFQVSEIRCENDRTSAEASDVTSIRFSARKANTAAAKTGGGMSEGLEEGRRGCRERTEGGSSDRGGWDVRKQDRWQVDEGKKRLIEAETSTLSYKHTDLVTFHCAAATRETPLSSGLKWNGDLIWLVYLINNNPIRGSEEHNISHMLTSPRLVPFH